MRIFSAVFISVYYFNVDNSVQNMYIIQAKKKKVVRVPTPRGEAKRRGRIMYEKARLLIELVQKRERNYIDNVSYLNYSLPITLSLNGNEKSDIYI